MSFEYFANKVQGIVGSASQSKVEVEEALKKALKEALVNKTIVNSHGWTPLIYVASRTDFESVNTVLDNLFSLSKTVKIDLQIDAQGPECGKTALIYAIERGNVEAVNKLIKARANVNAPDKKGKSPLMYAAEKSNTAIMKALIAARANIEATDHVGDTALIYAVSQSSSEFIKEFINDGADVNAVDQYGRTVLIHAAFRDDADIMQMLIGLDKVDLNLINARDNDNKTVLIHAACRDDADIMQMLIDLKKDDLDFINARDNDNKTVLIHAAFRGNADIMQRLIDLKKDDLDFINARDNDNKTAYIHAKENRKNDIIKVLKSVKGLDKKNGAGDDELDENLDQIDNNAEAVSQRLFDSVVNGDVSAFKEALQACYDNNCISKKNSKGVTAFELAVKKDSKELIKAFISFIEEKTINVESVRKDLAKGFCLALEMCNVDVVEDFLRVGKGIITPEEGGDKILLAAVRSGMAEFVEKLIAHKMVNPAKGGYEILLAAARSGMTKLAEQLIDNNIVISAEGGDEILLAAARSGMAELVKKLIENKIANPNAKDSNDWTALMYSALESSKDHPEPLEEHPENSKKHIITLKELLCAGAEISIKKTLDNSVKSEIYKGLKRCLFKSAEEGNTDVVQVFIDKLPADSDGRVEALNEALVRAAEKSHAEVVQVLVAELLKTDKGVEALNKTLKSAVENDHKNVVKVLVAELLKTDKGVEALNEALVRAAEKSHAEVVQVLIDKLPADSNGRVEALNKALVSAAEKGHTKLVQVLIDKLPADSNGRVEALNEALMRAAERGHKGVKELLIDAGAEEDIQEKRSAGSSGKPMASITSQKKTTATTAVENSTGSSLGEPGAGSQSLRVSENDNSGAGSNASKDKNSTDSSLGEPGADSRSVRVSENDNSGEGADASRGGSPDAELESSKEARSYPKTQLALCLASAAIPAGLVFLLAGSLLPVLATAAGGLVAALVLTTVYKDGVNDVAHSVYNKLGIAQDESAAIAVS
jgi:ankyrin repeat protein